jgi:hypothetical protein
MLTSILFKMKKPLFIAAILAICPFLCSFGTFLNEQEWITWGNRFLNESYDPTVEPKLKKYEISLTPDHFIRLRKTYQQGKQEYYSFNLKRFNALEYVPGQTATDTLALKTQTDDIIVQTYDDPKGDIDSMATKLNIPVKKLLPERLDSLKQAFAFFKSKAL